LCKNGPQLPSGKKLFWLSSVVGILYLGSTAWHFRHHFVRGNVDFLQLYSGARLVGTAGLYDPRAAIAIHYEVTGRHSEGVYYSRIPVYAWLLKPLARLPYRWAWGVFAALNLLSFAWFLRVFADREPALAVLGWFYPPLYSVLTNGQDVGLFLAAAAGGYLLLERRRPFAAGLAWSLCAIKPHLFLLVPLVLLIRRQWRALAGGLAGGTALLAGSFAVQGPDWIARYLALLARPELHPGPQHMPNFQAVRLALAPGHLDWLPWAGAAAAAALLAWSAARARDWRPAFALALPASLVGAWHAYMQDCLPLLLTCAVFGPLSPPPHFRALLLAVIAPVPPFLLLFGTPWSALLPGLLMLMLALAPREMMKAVDAR
jgi:hypothetical protein